MPPIRFAQHHAVGWMLASALSFACMSALSHGLSQHIHWTLVAVARTVIAAVFAAALAFVGRVPVVLTRPAALWVRSIAGSLSLLMSFLAISRLPLANALTLFNLQPLWILILSAVFFKVRIRASDILAILSGAIGVVLILRPHFGEEAWASLAAVASSLFAATAMMGLNRLGDLDVRSVVVHFSTVSSIAAIGASLLLDASFTQATSAPPTTLLLLVAVGATGTIGQLLLTKAYGTGRPPTVAAAGMSQIAYGAVFDYVLFDHRLDAATLAGMVLILLPSAWELTHPLRNPPPVADEDTTL